MTAALHSGLMLPQYRHMTLSTRSPLLWLIAVWFYFASPVGQSATSPATDWTRGFAQPPDATKPWCYWYWISDNLSREGITRDLESLARVGIGEALIGNIFLEDVPAGKIKVLTEEWWDLVEHAIREGGRVGVNIGMFNSPGWSQSGGPWIQPSKAMRYLVSSEIRVRGPRQFDAQLSVPKEPFQDVAVLAFPAPQNDADSLAARAARISSAPAAEGTALAVDGRLETSFAFPAGSGQGNQALVLTIELAEPLEARSLSLTPGTSGWAANCELQTAGAEGEFRSVRAFAFDRSNMEINVGPMPRGPVTVSFAPTTARRFRLLFTGVSGKAALAEINLSSAARVESFVEKQLGKMHPTPLPMWDTYLWPAAVEPETPLLAISPDRVLNLTEKLGADGTLRWEVPAGDWVILRMGMTPTGTRNAPASPEGQGLEVDKMNRAAARAHFDAFIGQVLRRMPAAERKAFKRVVADSYEMGSQNWTDGFAKTFRKRYGYDAQPWLPALSGRIVGSAELTDRFLWDLRRLVADRIATDYVGGLRDLCRPQGLQLWLENYGHWGFPAEFLQYGGQSDRIGGEFWVTGDLGSIELRAASSCANTYGRPIVSAEAFTGGPAFQTAPWGLKARGDWAFCEGINHFVLHVAIHQPWENRVPGVNAWFGTEFNRHNTWFEPGRAWVDYLRRCCFLLQQGTRVADVAYFIGEDAPKMTGAQQPPLPAGHDFDYINAEVLLGKVQVKQGRLTLPHGTTYRVLVLPELTTMRPELLRRVRDLVSAGATVIGPPPSRSPSLENYPKCDTTVRRLAAELWGAPGDPARRRAPDSRLSYLDRRVGLGRVVWGKDLAGWFEANRIPRDFSSETRLRFTHRTIGGTHIYFVANPHAQEVVASAAFRVTGMAPELWWPDTGRTERAAVYDEGGGVTGLPLQLGPHGSVFVVFREKTAKATAVIRVTRDGEPILDAQWRPAPSQEAELPSGAAVRDNFTLAVWVKPSADTTLLPEVNQGVHGLSEPRNDVLFPPHGDSFGGAGHAGCGLAAGRNGVVVFEHGANYFAPVLVHAAAVSDWTHVAVVYRDGQPNLYLDGTFARQGLKSRLTVHPGAGGAGGAPFRGQMGTVQSIARPLSETEIAQHRLSALRPGARPPGSTFQLTRSDNGLRARVWEAGEYLVQMADVARNHTFKIPAVPTPVSVDGPWEVEFTPDWGAPQKVTFGKLEDWSQRPEAGIRHYSGKARYQTRFELPSDALGHPDPAVQLDLGNVRDLATVRLNGKELGTLWIAPWRMDVTDAVRAGANVLEVEVVNTWNNRLVGDAALPLAQRKTFLAAKTVAANAPLQPAGLLGPVTIRIAKSVQLPSTTLGNPSGTKP